MSIRIIPDKYLNTTIDIFRDHTSIDTIGDYSTFQKLTYASLKANIQPTANSKFTWEIHGKVYIQTHSCYINRIEDSILRQLKVGDYVQDLETELRYTIIGIEHWQSMRSSISDSHHIKLVLEAITSMPLSVFLQTLNVKGSII